MAFAVSVLQPEIESGNVDENRMTISRLIRDAVSTGAQCVVLPEACVTDFYRGSELLAESIPGQTTEMISSMASDAVIVLPLLERHGGKIYSSCALLTRNGVKAVARKTHLYRDASGQDSFRDSEVISAGETLSVVEINGVKMGVLLGFDAEFPEVYRLMALRGADFCCVVLNTQQVDRNFLSGMALRNRLPLLISNRLGFKKVYPTMPEWMALKQPLLQDKEGSFLMRCKGQSLILDENGDVVAEANSESVHSERVVEKNRDTTERVPNPLIIPQSHFQEESILSASFTLEELRLRRLASPYLSECKASLYRL